MTKANSFTIHQHPIGKMDNYLYIIHDHGSNTAAVIDPAWDVPAILAYISDIGATLTTIYLTHSHGDHVNGLTEITQGRDLTVHISADEAAFWSATPAHAIQHKHGDTIKLGDTSITWLVTPGHTPGSSCLLLGDSLIAADTLFMFGCGRCDLAGSDPADMFKSLQTLKSVIPPETIVYPGHNYGDRPHSTMAEQLSGNPFLFWESESDFIQYRMVDHDKVRSSPYTPMNFDALSKA